MSEVILRDPRPGDLGWVIHRHGELYAREYGWSIAFEAHVAGIIAGFVENFDPRRDRCWIAEIDQKTVGSVFLVHSEGDAAKLRMLYVEPEARGQGVGRKLVEECLRFAREAGYRRVMLWTEARLAAARKIYEGAGFRMTGQQSEQAFGTEFVSQTWELNL